jgi:hypothetical protein
MTIQPPPGSNISVAMDGADTVIVVPYDSGGLARYGVAAFMVFWLGGWAYGWHDVAGKILAGNGNFFLVFWLGAWTVGGAAAGFALYRMLRPVVPESFRLMREGVRYDSGNPSVQMNFGPMNPRPTWSSMFPTRIYADIDRQQLRSLQLRQTALGNRLTVDAGVSRLDLARDATEIEREWLYQALAKHYSLAVPPAQ